MKKCISFIMVLALIFLSGCNSNNDKDTVKNGTYVMERKEADASLLPGPYVTISDNIITFSCDFLSSYMPIGSYSIVDGKLTMTTDDNKYIYIFQLDGDNLIFQKNESSSVNLIDDRLGIKVINNAKFHLKNN